MPQLFVAALLYPGAFPGVGLDSLMDRPITAPDVVVAAEGRQMAQYATALTFEERDGKTVGLPQKDFSLKLQADLATGDYLLSFLSAAPNRGSDWLWVSVDRQRLPAPLVLSVGALARNSQGVAIRQAGKHEIEVTLREEPGAVLCDVQCGRLQIKPPQPALRRELAGKHQVVSMEAK